MLFRQFTKDEHETLSTTWGPFASLSRDGRWLVLGYWVDTQSNDLWLADFDRFRTTGRLDRQVITTGEPGQAFGAVIDGILYLQTTKGAPKGRVVAVPAANPDRAAWRDLVPEREDAVIEAVTFGQGVIAVTYLSEREQRDRSVRSRRAGRLACSASPASAPRLSRPNRIAPKRT